MSSTSQNIAHYHLPGLFEFYEFYCEFLPLWRDHRDWFYEWCDIASIYGAPEGSLWSGGRTSLGNADARDILKLTEKYDISARLTFSNSLLKAEHLSDKKCNELCKLFEGTKVPSGVIVHSDLLLDYLKEKYPDLYLISSTTKVLTNFNDFRAELNRPDFKYIVPDFRLNKSLDQLASLPQEQKDKVEFLCNECCDINCRSRKACYENVSRKNLANFSDFDPVEEIPDHKCTGKDGQGGYKFSRAMKNPAFISIKDIQQTYLPMGFTNFKLEGRGLGSAVLLEFILYYMTKPEHQLEIREAIYLDAMLDLF